MSEIGILTFKPRFEYKIWGGEKLKTKLNKDCDRQTGESWEISGIKGKETIVDKGIWKNKNISELISIFKEKLVGEKCFDKFGSTFPILIKFIDAKEPLSVQVHPHNEIALKRHNSFGKNEMWYIMEANDNSELILGLSNNTTKSDYVNATKHSKNFDQTLNKVKVKKQDAVYIPTGRIHAIGGDILLAEIQQTSDITYRIYDYDRIDKKTGQKRELHIEESLETINFETPKDYLTKYSKSPNTDNKLIESPYFKTIYLEITNTLEKKYTINESFRIFICVEGKGKIISNKTETIFLKKGQTILIPAMISNITLENYNSNNSPEKYFKLIEVYL